MPDLIIPRVSRVFAAATLTKPQASTCYDMSILLNSLTNAVRNLFPLNPAMEENVNTKSLFDQCSFVVVRSNTLSDEESTKVSGRPNYQHPEAEKYTRS